MYTHTVWLRPGDRWYDYVRRWGSFEVLVERGLAVRYAIASEEAASG